MYISYDTKMRSQALQWPWGNKEKKKRKSSTRKTGGGDVRRIACPVVGRVCSIRCRAVRSWFMPQHKYLNIFSYKINNIILSYIT